jgi:hypothetical protein
MNGLRRADGGIEQCADKIGDSYGQQGYPPQQYGQPQYYNQGPPVCFPKNPCKIPSRALEHQLARSTDFSVSHSQCNTSKVLHSKSSYGKKKTAGALKRVSLPSAAASFARKDVNVAQTAANGKIC